MLYAWVADTDCVGEVISDNVENGTIDVLVDNCIYTWNKNEVMLMSTNN